MESYVANSIATCNPGGCHPPPRWLIQGSSRGRTRGGDDDDDDAWPRAPRCRVGILTLIECLYLFNLLQKNAVCQKYKDVVPHRILQYANQHALQTILPHNPLRRREPSRHITSRHRPRKSMGSTTGEPIVKWIH